MKIILSVEDLDNLSIQTKTEIMNYALQLQSTNGEATPVKDDNINDDENYEEDCPFEMTFRTTRVFMQGNISDKTKKALRIFAENNGEITNQKLLEAMGVKGDQELKGVFAGITRKIRRLDPSDDSEAYLIWWDEEPVTEGGLHYMSDMTTKSLKKYFDLT